MSDESAFSVTKGLSREEAARIVPRQKVRQLTEKWDSGTIEQPTDDAHVVPKPAATTVDLRPPADERRVQVKQPPPEDDIAYGCFCFSFAE